MTNPFTDHPASVDETYAEHLRGAWSFALPMISGGLAALAHGLLPFLFERTASETVKRLYARLSPRTTPKVGFGDWTGGGV